MRKEEYNYEKSTYFFIFILLGFAVGIHQVFGTSVLRMARATVGTAVESGYCIFQKLCEVIAGVHDFLGESCTLALK